MSVLYIVVPIAVAFAIGAIAAFVWAVRSGQLDDLETPAHRVLFDDVPATARPYEVKELHDGKPGVALAQQTQENETEVQRHNAGRRSPK